MMHSTPSQFDQLGFQDFTASPGESQRSGPQEHAQRVWQTFCSTPGSLSQLDVGHVRHPTKPGGLGDDFVKIFEHGYNFSEIESEKT
jgi:hypothetical protein